MGYRLLDLEVVPNHPVHTYQVDGPRVKGIGTLKGVETRGVWPVWSKVAGKVGMLATWYAQTGGSAPYLIIEAHLRLDPKGVIPTFALALHSR
jgi:hypothetical protein